MSKSRGGLAKVQNLYVLQLQLCDLLEGDLRSPDNRKKARECVREFKHLLQEVDPRYMGGEDVLLTLQKMQMDAQKKISAKAAIISGRKPMAKKAAKAKVVKAKKTGKATKKAKKVVKAKKKVVKAKKSPAKKRK